ncbi:SPFH domain-containing protein [Pendulispora albinea]|uniref:SPFH/Band 7/PHB domain protein n=1 Tax=Pendulispora albinea TaxID=2741071 RepID=A0ABZ2LVH9_9BACT
MMNDKWMLFAGLAAGFALVPILRTLVRRLRVEVEDEEVALVTRFGKLTDVITKPGWHWLVARALPFVNVIPVSLRRDFRDITNIRVNDARGTTVVVDVFLEFRITDPVKVTFDVADWDRSMRNVVSHAVISILGNRDFKQILCDRTELNERLQRELEAETQRWGIGIELALMRNVSLLPEVSQQVFHTIAARLERAKAYIEEEGHQRVALFEAQTSARIAELVADAKAQYPAAVGRAYADLKTNPEVFAAYETLYELSLVNPHRMTAFKGFTEGEIRSVDAAMLEPQFPPSYADGAPASGMRLSDPGAPRNVAVLPPRLREAVVDSQDG